MAILILSSSFTFYKLNEEGKKVACQIDNNNGFRECLQKYLTKRDLCLIISGNPKKVRTHSPIEVNREGFELSGIGFKEYIYVDDSNKHNIKEYISRADCIDLCGGHLPTCNAFVNELNLKELLKDYNGVIIGASGGAMNLADVVYCKPEAEGEAIDKNFNRFLKGCALTDINIIPHYNVIKDRVLDGVNILNEILLPDSYKLALLAIEDGSYIVQKGSEKMLYGRAFLLKNGDVFKINENDKCCKIDEKLLKNIKKGEKNEKNKG